MVAGRFLQERMAHIAAGGTVGECVLAFGFRHNKHQGELFHGLIEQAIHCGAITHYLPAESRPKLPANEAG